MPYPGQGKRVPLSSGVDGEWIIENEFFLVFRYRSKSGGRAANRNADVHNRRAYIAWI